MLALRVVWKRLAGSGVVKRAQQVNKAIFSDKYLLYTNIGISISLSSLGDILEQHYEIYAGDIDAWSGKRTSHMATSGATVGVICHYWYQLLDKRLPGRSFATVAKKVLLDQFICSPVYISAFFITLGILEENSPAEIWDEVKAKAWKLYAAEWVIWPAAQVINFYWLPTRYRILYDNTISLGYDVFTSKVKHNDP